LVNYLRKHEGIKTITDLGCGDGGLIEAAYSPEERFRGIDMAEANINYAQNRFKDLNNVTIEMRDFTKMKGIRSDLIICCETLEHLIDPLKLLRTIDCRFLITSVPMNETEDRHSEHHIWAWNEAEFRESLKGCGYDIIHTVRVNTRTQIVLGGKK
jgi:predicted TPR repeat methyltransferase